jgi:hypothetical protein
LELVHQVVKLTISQAVVQRRQPLPPSFIVCAPQQLENLQECFEALRPRS